MRFLRVAVVALVLGAMWPMPSQAVTSYNGYILRSPVGSIWYISPRNHLRYSLGANTAAMQRAFLATALGITNTDLAKIPVLGSTATGDLALRNRLAGYTLLQVQDHARLWWVTPVTKKRVEVTSLASTWKQFWGYSVPVSTQTILSFTAAAGFAGPPPRPVNGLTHIVTTVTNGRGTFTVDMLTLDRTATTLKVMTDTGNTTDCKNNCVVMSLGSYVTRRGGTAGIHGTYFCPADYSGCAGQVGSYFYPVYNSFDQVMINNHQIKFTTAPLVAFDTNNQPHYYHQAVDFKNQGYFEGTTGTTLRAAISNSPALVEGGKNILDTSTLDSKQATVKSFRGFLGWKGNVLYFGIVRGATVIDSASVARSLTLDYAINLDGGGSASLYSAGRYIIGPGRNLPNAIVLTTQ